MARRGVHHVVTRHRRFGKHADETLLAGHAPAGREDLSAIARFCADVREEFGDAPAVSRLPAVAGHDQPARLRKRTTMLPSFLTTTGAKIAAGLLSTTVVLGGATAAGALPDPIQRSVANLADNVGVHVPSPDDSPSVDDQAPAAPDAPDRHAASETDDTVEAPEPTTAEPPETEATEPNDTTATPEPEVGTPDATDPAPVFVAPPAAHDDENDGEQDNVGDDNEQDGNRNDGNDADRQGDENDVEQPDQVEPSHDSGDQGGDQQSDDNDQGSNDGSNNDQGD
jgi:hypothetical protein